MEDQARAIQHSCNTHLHNKYVLTILVASTKYSITCTVAYNPLPNEYIDMTLYEM